MTGADGYFDPDLFKQGTRKRIPFPEQGARSILVELIECSPIFVAATDCDAHERQVIGSALIRSIQSFSMETRAFLAHGKAPMSERLSVPISVVAPSGITFEGLHGLIC
jgi:hypothetical protein